MRAYQKRVIVLKNTDSKLFEEAYFVIKDGGREKFSRDSMAKEAARIIEESFPRKGRRILKLSNIICFIMGSALSLIAAYFIF